METVTPCPQNTNTGRGRVALCLRNSWKQEPVTMRTWCIVCSGTFLCVAPSVFLHTAEIITISSTLIISTILKRQTSHLPGSKYPNVSSTCLRQVTHWGLCQGAGVWGCLRAMCTHGKGYGDQWKKTRGELGVRFSPDIHSKNENPFYSAYHPFPFCNLKSPY